MLEPHRFDNDSETDWLASLQLSMLSWVRVLIWFFAGESGADTRIQRQDVRREGCQHPTCRSRSNRTSAGKNCAFWLKTKAQLRIIMQKLRQVQKSQKAMGWLWGSLGRRCSQQISATFNFKTSILASYRVESQKLLRSPRLVSPCNWWVESLAGGPLPCQNHSRHAYAAYLIIFAGQDTCKQHIITYQHAMSFEQLWIIHSLES